MFGKDNPVKLLEKRLSAVFRKEKQAIEHYLKTFNHELSKALVETTREDPKVLNLDNIHMILVSEAVRNKFLEIFRRRLDHDDSAFKKTLHTVLHNPEEDFAVVHGAVMDRFRAILEEDSSTEKEIKDSSYFTHHVWVELQNTVVNTLAMLMMKGE